MRVDSAAAPLPDPVIPIIQWIFQRPPWVMWGGVVLGLIVAGLALRWFWPRRAVFRHWLVSLQPGGKTALAVALLVVLAAAAGAGYKSYDFVENDRRFCAGCHIFVPSGVHITLPDTGSYTLVNELEGKHDTLSCHACHTLNMVKEAVKMVFWMSGDRGEGERVPPHAKVPRHICEGCHVQGEAKQFWQAIATTAGHRTHLESDSLKGKVECLTCHARAPHRFIPRDTTCTQAGCHLSSQTAIKLGKMAGQTDLHCGACHHFTKEVPLLATRDSAMGSLRPAQKQCLDCHSMQLRLVGFDRSHDPHNGSCGTCHNPHAQVKPADALKSCTTAGCHDTWRNVPFHSGKAHGRVNTKCELCHQPHAARVDASDCTGCHARVGVKGGGHGPTPPQPFDTTKALKRTSSLPPPVPRRLLGHGDAPPEADLPAALSSPPPLADSFPHSRHTSLACITCHSITAKKTTLTFEAPRGCQICHHQAPSANECARCHEDGSGYQQRQVSLTIAIPNRPDTRRIAGFSHTAHAVAGKCIDCHTTAVTMTPADSVTNCSGCHEQHHTRATDCAGCHAIPGLTTAHADARRTHFGCDACHTARTVALLTPNRALCLTCHNTLHDHNPTAECTTCHFLQNPDEWRSHLVKQEKGR